MANSIEFVKDRAVKTISAAKQVAPKWAWDEKSIDAMAQQPADIAGDKNATPPVAGQEAVTRS